jgi:hypothetical protein
MCVCRLMGMMVGTSWIVDLVDVLLLSAAAWVFHGCSCFFGTSLLLLVSVFHVALRSEAYRVVFCPQNR